MVTKVLRHKKLLAAVISLILLAVVAGCSQAPTGKTGGEGTQPPTVTKYANPRLLTETSWLKEHLGDADLVILDARAPEEYKTGHIKGAVNLPAHSTDVTVGAVPSILAPPAKLAQMLGKRGVSNDSNVVVYDMQITPPAGRMFWMLEYLGHAKVSVLDGGMAKWKKEGGQVTKDVPTVAKATYTPAPVDSRYATKDEVRTMIGKKDAVLVDTRPLLEYAGGHLEGATRLDWVESLTKDTPPVMKSAPELAKLFADAGITKDKDVAGY